MSFIQYMHRTLSLVALCALALPMGSRCTYAETRQLATWRHELAAFVGANDTEIVEQETAVAQIRSALTFWIEHHPSTGASLPEAPVQPWSSDEIRTQISLLQRALETAIKEDPNQPFELGTAEISVTADAPSISPLSDALNREEMGERQLLTVAAALDVLPGVAIDHAAGPRNEAQGRIRGFSTRGQAPLYLDGVPIYLPYDGYVDFNRFLSNDYAEVQVSKGYSSPLLGPNGLGGAINLVTRRPERKLETEALIGTGSGGLLLSSLRLGSRWDRFYVQGSFDWLERDHVPLSGAYALNPRQTTFERNLSDSRDEKYSARIAWTPKGQDQYSFTFVNQKGKKNGLQYIGPNDAAVYNRFWKWPYWNKNGYYLITNTGIGESSAIKFRAHYDQFRNGIDMFDDATYSTMNNRNSEHSRYDDHTQGASSEFTTRAAPHHTLSASLFFKDDTHTSREHYPGRPPYPLVTPDILLRDQIVSIGFQDIFTPVARLRLTFGFSADHLQGRQARDYNRAMTALVGVRCFSRPYNTSFSECTARAWSFNPQVSASYDLTTSDTLFVIFSDRGRFPLLKERYSYGMGSGVPNPDLRPEHSRNWDVGYSRAFAGATILKIDWFRSNLRDVIQPVYVRDSAGMCSNTGAKEGFCSQNFNIGREVHQGAEITIRSTPIHPMTLEAHYTYINRTLAYDFGRIPDVSELNTAIVSLPSMPRNKFVGTMTLGLPHRMLALATLRIEGGIMIQDTTYRPAPPPSGTYLGVVDVGAVVPVRAGLDVQAGVKNLFDRNYCYTAGYPEAGRNWHFNLRYRF